MEKKCKYCAMMIPKEAKICPHCRKKQGISLLGKIVIGLFLLVLFSIFVSEIGKQPAQRLSSEQASTSTKLGPKFLIKVQKSTYEYGYLKVSGVVENVGDESGFSPTIKLKVYDSSSKTLLAEDATWPAGQYLKNMTPGISAAFEFIQSIPGEPPHIRYKVTIENYNYDTRYK
jgi:hypothetical protein